MKKNCRVWKREQNQGNQKKEENKNTTTPFTCSDEDVAIVVEECLHVDDQMIEWVVDTARHTMLCQIENCSAHTKKETLSV